MLMQALPKPYRAGIISSRTMTRATQSELRLARRMSRLGTETAFEVLVKARALEAKGRDIVHLDIGELASLITDRTKVIILNSPQNPTGGMMTEQDVRDLARVIGDRDIMVLSDEIYSRLIFEGKHFSILSVDRMKERTILLDGFSKTYAMTGWRMGYGVMRPDLATHVARLMTNSNSCTASFTQVAGIEALEGDQASVDNMNAEFRRRRDRFYAGINQVKGFSCL